MKIIKIENCRECIYSKKDYYYYYCYDFVKAKRIDDISTIPSWCPLEDYKETDHEAPV